MRVSPRVSILVATIAGAYTVATLLGYLLPLLRIPTVEAISIAFIAGLVAGFLVDDILERIE